MTADSSQPSTVKDYQYTAKKQVCYAGSANSTACSSPPTGSDPYTYEAAGNLTGNNGKTQTFTSTDELCWSVSGTSSNACGSAPSGATSYSYNTNGDRTATTRSTGSATAYTYNSLNQLTQYQLGSAPATTYAYDGDGLRMSKTTSGTPTSYNWSDAGGLPLLLQETTGSNTTNYVYGPTGQPIEEILPSGSGYYYSQDALGSTRALTNSPGTATDTDTYDPYGNLTASTGTVQDNLLYAAQYLDAESGLYYLRARYYDTATGQFLTVDPQVATTLEPYAYVSSDPENGVDPTGKNVVPISSIGLNLNAGKPGWNLGYGAHCANPVYSGGGQMPCSDASTIGRACEAKGGSVHAKLSCEGSIYYAAYLSAFDWLQAREFANTWYWSLFHTFYFPYNIATYMQGQEYFGLQGDIYVDNLEVRQWQATGEQGSQQDIYDEGTDNCADGGGYFTCPGLHADRYWADFDFASAT